MQKFDINSQPFPHNPFSVPEGYFEQLAENVMQRVRHIPVAASVRPMPILRWIPLLGAACVAALAIVFAQVGDNASLEAGTGQSSISSVTLQNEDEEIFDYLMLADADIMNIEGNSN